MRACVLVSQVFSGIGSLREELSAISYQLLELANGRWLTADSLHGSVQVDSTVALFRSWRSTAASRSLYFWILPLAVIGYSSTKSTYSGTLCRAIPSRQYSLTSSSDKEASCFFTTAAATFSPYFSSGTP